jgi:hypothetical protein
LYACSINYDTRKPSEQQSNATEEQQAIEVKDMVWKENVYLMQNSFM